MKERYDIRSEDLVADISEGGVKVEDSLSRML